MKQDIIILGGGIIGVTLGFHLARAGLRPLILEPNAVASGTTSSSFAWANASTKTTDIAYHKFNVAGMVGYRALAAEFGFRNLGVTPSGALQIVDATDDIGMNTLVSNAKNLLSFGYKAEIIGTAALRALEPGLKISTNAQALHLRDDLIIDAPHFTDFLAAQMIALGGAIRTTKPTSLIANDDGVVTGVETPDGPLFASSVICAVGKDTGRVLAELTGFTPFSSRFPLREVPGLILTTPPMPSEKLNHLIYTLPPNEVHLLPTAQGGLKIGSDNVDAMIWDDRSTGALEKAGRTLLSQAERFLPGLTSRVSIKDCALRVGIRPYPEDGKSLIGALPGAQGLYIIATHSGITLAPIIAALMTQWIDTGTKPAQLAPYCLSRIPGFATL